MDRGHEVLCLAIGHMLGAPLGPDPGADAWNILCWVFENTRDGHRLLMALSGVCTWWKDVRRIRCCFCYTARGCQEYSWRMARIRVFSDECRCRAKDSFHAHCSFCYAENMAEATLPARDFDWEPLIDDLGRFAG